MVQRSDEKLKGVNKITFTKYYELPGIISERFYAVFDRNNNGYLDVVEFIEGFKTLFTESFEKTSKFIFDFYDFDKDGLISKEDIRTVMSYVPLNTKDKVVLGESFKDRIESQEELHETLEKSFKDYQTELVNYKQFVEIVENVCSDIYFFLLVFLLEKRPFSKQALAAYEKIKTPTGGKSKHLGLGGSQPGSSPSKLIASPSMNSKFSPSTTLSKSPILKASNFSLDGSVSIESKEHLTKYLRSNEKHLTMKEDKNLGVRLLEKKREPSVNKIPVNRKVRHNLKNIDDSNSKKVLKNSFNEKDLVITPAIKTNIKTKNTEKAEKVNSSSSTNSANLINVEATTEVVKDNEIQYDDTSDDEADSVQCDGYLYKLTDSKKLKKIWFKLFQKDFYYFKNETEKMHKGMHNLSGVFVKEEKPTAIDNVLYHTFSVSYPKKVRYYFTDSEEDMKRWVSAIKKATGYSDLTDIYEVKEKLGNGKFGLVKLGIHKTTGQKVAIKIMSKKEMNNQDLELVKTEIEILRICQHPYIIRLVDVFENVDYVYAIMEYCQGGDLFSYIEKRGFRLPEPRACQIIHKLCASVYYIHSYGIAHRDLKPENILMTDSTDEADIRLLDFGLSKIIGPTENCTEPYGTLSYVAPEVLLEQPYTKAVDLWSIGITTYLLLAGCLPFDHESSEREIARQTIHDPVRWGSIWKKLSPEAKSFVDSNLCLFTFRFASKGPC